MVDQPLSAGRLQTLQGEGATGSGLQVGNFVRRALVADEGSDQ